jgi:tRNA pseudouridine55 synthase
MAVSGFLNIDKPPGMTSHDVVAVVRRGTKTKKVGHAGTLDPLATGVLVICVGSATRLSEYAMRHTKTYVATVMLGVETDTYDAEGEIVARDERQVTRQEVEALLPRLSGDIEQVPPMYSAIKQGGKKLYELARAGQDVERAARKITIHHLALISWNFPEFVFEVECSAGTYVRSLAHDIGQMLGVGGHLAALRRTRSGEFHIEQAVPLQVLRTAITNENWKQHLLPVDLAVRGLPRLDLNAKQSKIVEQGGFLPREILIGDLVRAYDENGQFFALLETHPRLPDHWKPRKVFR